MAGICDGRVVIITGAGGGLGAAHARVMAAEGASVIVNDINTEADQAVVDEITAAAHVMRELASRVQIKHDNLIDTCGTGGDGHNTFNISTTAAVVGGAAGG